MSYTSLIARHTITAARDKQAELPSQVISSDINVLSILKCLIRS